MHLGADLDVSTFTRAADANVSPEELEELQVIIYVLLVSTGILLWDIVSHLADDYRILTKYSLQTPVLVYFTSRLSALGLCLTGIIMGPAKIDMDCHIGVIFLELFFSLVVITTTGLFALRVRAVYVGHRLVRITFLVMWLAVVGSCFLAFFIVGSLKNTERIISSCLLVEKGIITGLLIAIIAMVHDTAVFLAIGYQMYRCSRLTDHSTVGPVVKFFLQARSATDGMPPLIKCLIQDGQLYYLISLFWEVLIIVLLIMPSIGPYYRCFMLPAHLVIVNSIACTVFRNVKLGKFREETISYRNTSGDFTSIVSLDVEHVAVRFAPVDLATTVSVVETPMHTWDKDNVAGAGKASEVDNERRK
ncbi:hypothetical protein VKT23_015394 [Stygiomarasmius scandens]|uniref:Uncharacterized protein n=1 Tax=Marasmiellus scandens TaxID=2682957 RepID=A0ABR1J211_9AGAR